MLYRIQTSGIIPKSNIKLFLQYAIKDHLFYFILVMTYTNLFFSSHPYNTVPHFYTIIFYSFPHLLLGLGHRDLLGPQLLLCLLQAATQAVQRLLELVALPVNPFNVCWRELLVLQDVLEPGLFLLQAVALQGCVCANRRVNLKAHQASLYIFNSVQKGAVLSFLQALQN